MRRDAPRLDGAESSSRAACMPTTQDIVQKLWNLCNILRDDGITYHEYVTELTYLLFLKMAKETGTEDQIPKEAAPASGREPRT